MTTYRKPWVQRHWILVLLLSLGLMFVLMIVAAMAGVYSMMAASKKAPPYVEAMKRVRSSSEVAALLGQPVNDEWWGFGVTERTENEGKALFVIPVIGPRGRAQVHVDARLENGVWEYKQLAAQPEGSKEIIDLR